MKRYTFVVDATSVRGWQMYYVDAETEEEAVESTVLAQTEGHSRCADLMRDAVDALTGWHEQHGRDSAELRRLCAERDEAKAKVAALESELAALANQEPTEWQSRYMGDPRQPGFWQRCDNVEWAESAYDLPNHTTGTGWEVRPVYARPVLESAEPVAWIGNGNYYTRDREIAARIFGMRPVYAHPPASAAADWQTVCAEAYNIGREDGEAETRPPAAGERESLLREVASLKRHDPNRDRGASAGKRVVVSAPAELFKRIDAAIAAEKERK